MKSLLCILFSILLLSSCSTIRSFQDRKEKKNFHIYLLLGQSNMAGRGAIEGVDTIAHPRVFMLNKDTSWVRAKDPLHFDQPEAVGTGLGLSFGKKMAEYDDRITIGLIPSAVGGSSINQWLSGAYHEATSSYPYDEAIARTRKGMKRGVVKGVLWHQGEADCKTEDGVEAYRDKLLSLKDNLEIDLDIKSIPIVIGEVGLFLYDPWPLAKNLNQLFGELSLENQCIGLVKSDGLSDKGDEIHFNSESYRELGARYADEMIRLQEKPRQSKRIKKRKEKMLNGVKLEAENSY